LSLEKVRKTNKQTNKMIEREKKKERGLHAAPLPFDTLIHAGVEVCDLAQHHLSFNIQMKK